MTDKEKSKLPPISCLFDVETIGAQDGATIVQIGAVLFSMARPQEFGAPPDTIAIAKTLHVDTPMGSICPAGFRANIEWGNDDLQGAGAATLKWWLTQTNDDARRRVFGGDEKRIGLRSALASFSAYAHAWGEAPTYWWSDMDFDLRLMRQAYKKFGDSPRCPFGADDGPHRGVRDYRTIRWVGETLGVERPPFVGVQHDALDDAFAQAFYTMKVLKHLGIEG